MKRSRLAGWLLGMALSLGATHSAHAMNAQELKSAVAAKTTLTNAQASLIVDRLLSVQPGEGVIADQLAQGNAVAFGGLGTLKVKTVQQGNLQVKEVVFVPSLALARRIAGTPLTDKEKTKALALAPPRECDMLPRDDASSLRPDAPPHRLLERRR